MHLNVGATSHKIEEEEEVVHQKENIVNLYRFIQTVLKDQRLKRPGLWWQSQGNKKLVEISKRSSNKLGVYITIITKKY